MLSLFISTQNGGNVEPTAMDSVLGVESVESEEETATNVGDEGLWKRIFGRQNIGEGSAIHVLHHDLFSDNKKKKRRRFACPIGSIRGEARCRDDGFGFAARFRAECSGSSPPNTP